MHESTRNGLLHGHKKMHRMKSSSPRSPSKYLRLPALLTRVVVSQCDPHAPIRRQDSIWSMFIARGSYGKYPRDRRACFCNKEKPLPQDEGVTVRQEKALDWLGTHAPHGAKIRDEL
ncbi:unnamed protein product [Periconia digitata]|uniref:Uncharacterized protein n=1 Tax=Periconia digitata TaxID=1303443 RepID=A0A9W4XGV2_9PLEO|nr:unnamed protein product [Periconia digitata]